MDKFKKILIIVIIVGVAFVLYTYFFKGDSSSTLLSPERIGEAQESAVERELLSLLIELRSVQLSGEIFEDPAFQSLNDFGQVLEPQPIGRRNPFAPIGEE
jgi:hypothetical protein